MARHDARNWPDSTKMIGLLCLVASILAQHGTSGQRVKVEPEVLSYPGQTVNLRCAFTDAAGIQLTMITWIYEPKEGDRLNIAVFHPSFEPNYPDSPVKGRVSFTPSPPKLVNPSLQITDVRISDEGKYICEYATYPSGNEQGISHLVMLAKPQNSASIVTVEAGTKPVVVARCESMDGRPAAQISWVTTANGNDTTTSTTGAENTMTVNSEYRMIPTAKDNGKDISCLVAHRTQVKPESFLMKLAIQYLPQVTILGYDNNWYVGRTNVMLTCQATANPLPTSVNWKTMSGEMPDTVQITGNELKILKVDEAVNTTFVCEVRNRIGTNRDQVTAMVREPSQNPSNAGVVAGAVIGSLLALLLVAALIAVLVTRSRRQQQGYRANGGSDMKTRIFGGGKKASKNGTGGGAGSGGVGGGTRLPEKGPTTGSIIGGIIGVILLLAIIGTAIAMYRKHRNNKLNGDDPPKYKPPPPQKTNSSANRQVNSGHAPVAETRPLQNHHHYTQSAEPVTDLDAYQDGDDDDDDGGVVDRERYYSPAPSGWDDPSNAEVPPPYMHTDSDPQEYHQGLNVYRGDSFVSPAMFV